MPGKRLVSLVLLLAALALTRVCLAHPMGNFSVNHYSKITFGQRGIRLDYFIDLAEIPTFQELQAADLKPGDTAAIAPFLTRRGAELARGLSLRIDGTPVPLQKVSQAVIFPPGAGGLPTMKLGYVYHAAYPKGTRAGTATLAYADGNFPGHAGWKEIVVTGPPALLLSSTAPKADRSAELSNYPTDLLNSAPQDLAASARIALPAALAPVSEETAAIQARSSPGTAGASRPIAAAHPHRSLAEHSWARTHTAMPAPTVPLPRAAVPAAPVHLQANRQETARSSFTQLVTTEHLSLWFLLTAAFISMGLGALHALEPGHGKTIVAAYLVGSRGTARHALLLGLIVTAAHTASVFALGAITLYASRYILPEQLYPWLGVLSGLTVAALGAYLLLRRWTGEDMDHAHAAGQMHGHWFSRKSQAETAPGEPKTAGPVSLAQLFTLGITGGIIPCPAALVVLLSAFALHRVGFGFFLITAFSVGLAAVLIAFGLLMVHARRFMSRILLDGPLTKRWLPVASAAAMTILGAGIATHAFLTTGIDAHSFSPSRVGPALFVAGLGLVLGVRHSTDPDHVVAISTIVTRQRSIRGAALIGGMWGLGHTLTIFLVGCLIILGGITIPTRVGLSMEFSVALMLILLGMLNLTGAIETVRARFSPRPAAEPAIACAPGNPAWRCLRPLAIGLVHGLAGSAAVALLVLSTIHNPLWALVYLLIFGGGTLLGMMAMTVAMSLPLAYAGTRTPRIGRFLGVASGLVSVCFGVFLVYQLGFLGGLFTSHPHWTPQ